VSRRNLILLVVLSAIWGSSFLFIKVGVRELSPSVVVLGRLVVGAAVLLPLTAFRGGLGPLGGRLGAVALLGLFNNALPFWLLGFAEERIDSGLTAVIQAAAPIFTVLVARRIDPSQRVGRSQLAGVGVGFVGVALLVGVQRGGGLIGAFAVVGTALCYAFSVLFAGRVTATSRRSSSRSASLEQLQC
jgi:drug/metabolite transporter (DMT)-like permease